jgi:hypothetical protein
MVNPIMSDRKSKGFILPLVVLLTLVLALLFPLLTKLTLSETEKTTRYTQRKGNVDLIQMAEEKAVFFLRKDSSLWDSLQEGHAIPGYNDDVEYAEDQKGFFKVKITSGPAANQITIQIKAVGPSRQFLKTMRAIYGRPQLGSITAENINIEGVASSLFPHAHWAPLYASTIALDPLFLDLHYPRKISKGEVKPADMSSSTPNTNDLDYWAYVDEPFAYPLTPDLP